MGRIRKTAAPRVGAPAGVAIALIAVGYFLLQRPVESAPTMAQNTGAGPRPLTTEKRSRGFPMGVALSSKRGRY
jgi:hypothetical protein